MSQAHANSPQALSRIPDWYRTRAHEVRAVARKMRDTPRQMMLELAVHWDVLAAQAEHLNQMDGVMGSDRKIAHPADRN